MKPMLELILGIIFFAGAASVSAGDCGDVNNDGNVNVLDMVFIINYKYKSGPAPEQLLTADVNSDGNIDILDVVYLIDYKYKSGPEPDCPVIDNIYDILFIGSSYFNYNNLPGLVAGLIESENKTVNIHTAIQNGLYLEDHAAMTTTEAKINELDWDYIVLQGGGLVMAYPDSFPDYHPVYPALVTLKNKIIDNCDATKIIFELPWAFEDGMIWVSGWTDEYPQMQQKIYDNTMAYSDNIGFIISPVGWAWNRVLEDLNYPLHYLHLSDWNHPSLKGSYLMACVIYSTIYKESTVGNEYTAGLLEAEAQYFQTVGSSMVLDSLELWKID